MGVAAKSWRATAAEAAQLVVLEPRCLAVRRWDVVVLLALLFTAILTPFEESRFPTRRPTHVPAAPLCAMRAAPDAAPRIGRRTARRPPRAHTRLVRPRGAQVAFLSGFPPSHAPPPEDTSVAPGFQDALFALNRVCDLLFLADIILQFNIAFVDVSTQRVERARRTIARRYLCGAFFVDVVSTVPFDLIASLAGSSGDAEQQSALRAMRALRLIKLLRLARLGRVFRRLQEDVHIPSGYITLLKFLLATLLLTHWLACGLHMVVQFEGVRLLAASEGFLHADLAQTTANARPVVGPMLALTAPRSRAATRRRTATGWRRCTATAPSRAPPLQRSCRPWGACTLRR
jgi:hypothetical protein